MKTILIFFTTLLLYVVSLESRATITVTGASRVCPGQTYPFYVDNLPIGTLYWSYQLFQDGAFLPTVSASTNNAAPATFNLTFNSQFGTAKIIVRAHTILTPVIETYTKYIDKTPPSPASPNNGLVIGCYGGEQVSVLSGPSLQNNANDYFFHCAYQ